MKLCFPKLGNYFLTLHLGEASNRFTMEKEVVKRKRITCKRKMRREKAKAYISVFRRCLLTRFWVVNLNRELIAQYQSARGNGLCEENGSLPQQCCDACPFWPVETAPAAQGEKVVICWVMRTSNCKNGICLIHKLWIWDFRKGPRVSLQGTEHT